MSAIGAWLAKFLLDWLWVKVLAGVTATYASYKAGQIIEQRSKAAADKLQNSVTEQERKDAARDSLGNL
jgi:hypothetical protein